MCTYVFPLENVDDNVPYHPTQTHSDTVVVVLITVIIPTGYLTGIISGELNGQPLAL